MKNNYILFTLVFVFSFAISSGATIENNSFGKNEILSYCNITATEMTMAEASATGGFPDHDAYHDAWLFYYDACLEFDAGQSHVLGIIIMR